MVAFQAKAGTDEKNKIAGTWEYSAPTAPYPYTSGRIVLTEAENGLAGELVVNGNRLPASSVAFENDELVMEVEIEYNLVTVKFKLVDGSLVGEANSPDGPVEVKASRID
ncbi:hypothetical protein NT017_37000 [Prolixibacter sp. NT017]|nr:hypothetical protein NT017_37000 [Prolixibacter sp. NT017]